MNENNNLLAEQWNALIFTLRMNARYHERRRMFFDRWNSITNVLVLLSGSSAVITLLTELLTANVATAIFSGVATTVSVLDLVVGTARMARTHEIIFRRYVDLERMWSNTVASDESLKNITDLQLQIQQDEPPPLTTLLQLCYNEVCKSMGHEVQITGIKTWHKLLAHFMSLDDPNRKREVVTFLIP